MLETKEQKEIFIGSIALVLILAMVTACGNPKVNNNTNQSQNNNQASNLASSQAYLNYLRDLKVDPKASSELYQQLLTQDDIKKEVDSTLQTNQAINPPQVSVDQSHISNASGQAAVSRYLSDTVGPALSFNQQTASLNPTIFQSDSNVPDAVRSQLTALQNTLSQVTVPQEAVNLHKDLLSSLAAYQNLLTTATQFVTQQNTEPWAQVYQAYADVQKTKLAYSNELNRLANKYKISEVTVNMQYAESNNAKGSFLVPKAQAFLGLPNISITIGDIPRQIIEGIASGFLSSFSSFMINFLQKMITKIETTYKISNFLYYTDALVSTQYGQDYLNKYVPDPLDQKLIKSFIPQFSCGAQNGTALDSVFKAKAAATLGFDPANLDPSDPDYYSKLSSVGNFLSSPQGWNQYYQDLASQTQSAAQTAADQELTSAGFKDPRSLLNGSITSSVSSIVNGESAALKGIIDSSLGVASNPISSGISKLTESILNQFVFVGATQNSVIKEQPTCLAAGQMQLVAPPPSTKYTPPPPPPTAQFLTAQDCEATVGLNDTCTNAILGELQICVQNPPSSSDGMTNCSNMANSSYVDAMTQECQTPSSPTSTPVSADQCSTLQQYLSSLK